MESMYKQLKTKIGEYEELYNYAIQNENKEDIEFTLSIYNLIKEEGKEIILELPYINLRRDLANIIAASRFRINVLEGKLENEKEE